ncbi:MAG TPA: carboxypeptidase-like regulatory domain-containing protein, partial [Phnomibacter sp.]|nr:carboxypeptidase-like regulatory domain-containing protein [Phnomibacter sp.]
VAKCLDESCDDKGKVVRFRIRPLLVPLALMDQVTDLTEAGRGWKAASSIRDAVGPIKVPPLWGNADLTTVTTPNAFAKIYTDLLDNNRLDNMAAQMQALFAAFPWLFDAALECIKGELNAQTPGALFAASAKAFRNSAANRMHIQYLYDHVRDVARAYNELYEAVSDLVSECGGNERLFPFHIGLGIPLTNEVQPCFREQKFAEPHHRYRSHFIASPLVAGQFGLYEKVQFLFKRLVRMVAHFLVDTNVQVEMKVTPSRDFGDPLRKGAVPFYYQNVAGAPLLSVWDHQHTRRNKLQQIRGYHLGTQDQLLDADLAPNDFYRIEGLCGKDITAVVTQLQGLQQKFQLPFQVRPVPLNPSAIDISKCTWPDLQEDYAYYRDRVTGYLKEIMQWLPVFLEGQEKHLAKDLEVMMELFKKLLNLLREVRCIEHFPYGEWKKIITELWRIIFEAYARQQEADRNTQGAFHILNSIQNVANIFLFAPLYRIWFSFMHRRMVLQQQLQQGLSRQGHAFAGLEHLAGVRRGHTFLVVFNEVTGQVLGDFSVPGGSGGCDCGCTSRPCDGKHRTVVAPLQKPVMMVIYPGLNDRFKELGEQREYAMSKMMAIYNNDIQAYELRLDEMGFYKGDSKINEDVKVDKESGSSAPDVKARWDQDHIIFSCLLPRSEKGLRGGVHLYRYTLTGDFDEQEVTGRLIVIIAGVLDGVVDDKNRTAVFTVNMNSTAATAYYPYDNTAQPSRKYRIEVDYPVAEVNLGRERVRSFASPAGNQLAILTDEQGNDFIRLLKAAKPGIEDIHFVLRSGTDSVASVFALNIVDPGARLDSDKVRGVILSDKGDPIANAKVISSSGKEVITNEKGEYMLEGVKAGEVIKVESRSFETVVLQANKTMGTEIKMQPAKDNVLNVLEKVEMPEVVKEITRNLNLGGIRSGRIK